jgi:hypothetical protein
MSEPGSTALAAAAELLERAIDDPDLTLPTADLQRLLAAAVRHLVAATERGEAVPPFPPEGEGAPTATEIMVATTALLAAADVELFELGMWQTWGNVNVAAPAAERDSHGH